MGPLPSELGRHLQQDEPELGKKALLDLRLAVVDTPVEEPVLAMQGEATAGFGHCGDGAAKIASDLLPADSADHPT